MRTKKVKSTGRFRASYGSKVKERVLKIEEKQKKKQTCPYCKKKTAKRIAKGLWKCNSCKTKFAAGAYWIE